MILITGISGLLGANLALCAAGQNLPVAGLYHHHKVAIPGVKWMQSDITDLAATRQLILNLRPEWIIHCAAMTDVDRCQEFPDQARQVNELASRNLAAAAQAVGAGIVYISTDSVFDGETGGYREEDMPRAINEYAESKLAGELAVQEAMDEAIVIRTNIYGWNAQSKQSLAEWVLGRLESRQLVPGFSDVIFCPILVNDLGQVILDMMQRRLAGLYHVVGSQACTKYDFALKSAEVFGLDASLVHRVSIEDSKMKAPRPKNTSMETVKVSRELGRELPDVMSGLRKMKALRDSGFTGQLKAMNGVQNNAKV